MAKSKSKKKQPKQTKDTNGPSNESSTTSNEESKPDDNLDDMSLSEVFHSHPLIRVGKFVVAPYLLYLSYYFVLLQKPEYLAMATFGVVQLRQAVHGTTTPRQMLIVGTPSSGTVQIKDTLRSTLKLEVEHETTDAAWSFCRDGSISWFHGIRFFDMDHASKMQSIQKICSVPFETLHNNLGFHPAMYGPPQHGCSYRSKYDECWKKECHAILQKEWGCMSSSQPNEEFDTSCDIQFETNLHQVRNPMDNINSLVVKVCQGGLEGTVDDLFVTYASALFPQFFDFNGSSCIDTVGYFVVFYQEAMKEALRQGAIDGFYRIEDSSACDIAQMAGLLSEDTAVYEPNVARVKMLCDGDGPATKVVAKKKNQVNKGQVSLGWEDLLGGAHGSKRKVGDDELVKRVKELFVAFGYDPESVPWSVESSYQNANTTGLPQAPDAEWPEAWLMDSKMDDQKKENRQIPNAKIPAESLRQLGIHYWKMDADAYKYPVKAVPWDPTEAIDPRLSQLRDDRGYNYADIITIHPDHLPGFDDKIKAFFEEHIHDAEEIRYILDGSGYFDVRDLHNNWVRIHIQKGDLMTLPEGIYHRFTCDETNYIQAMRLFQGQPVWTPFNRPQEDHPSRKAYVNIYMNKADTSGLGEL